MMFLVVGNIPLLYVLNHSWFETLMYSIPGKSPWQSVLPSYCFPLPESWHCQNLWNTSKKEGNL